MTRTLTSPTPNNALNTEIETTTDAIKKEEAKKKRQKIKTTNKDPRLESKALLLTFLPKGKVVMEQ